MLTLKTSKEKNLYDFENQQLQYKFNLFTSQLGATRTEAETIIKKYF